MPVPSAAREARALAARVCAGVLPPEVCATAVLLASELVTNAIVHAGTPIDLRVVATRDEIRIEVTDGTHALPRVYKPSPVRVGGRGLQMVQRCATRWGVDQRRDGKVVWAEIHAA